MWTNSISAKYKITAQFALLTIVVLVGLAVRLHQVQYNFDGDEVFSVKLASSNFEQVLSGSLQDRSHPPLYNILLHIWVNVFGSSELSARSLSVLFSGFFLIVAYVLLRRFVPPWQAFGILSIFALSPLFVYYGQQARPYALITLLSAINILAFIRVPEIPHKHKPLIFWAGSCFLLVYTQYLGIVMIACQVLFSLFLTRLNKQEKLKILAYGALGSASMLPWFFMAMGRKILGGADPLTMINWMSPPKITEFVFHYISVFGTPPGIQCRWLLVLLAIPGIDYTRHLLSSKRLSADQLLMFILCFGPPIIVFLESVWGPKPIFATRQLLGAEIAFVITIAICIKNLPRIAAAGILFALLAWTVVSLPQAFPANAKPSWGLIAKEIDNHYPTMTVIAQEQWVQGPLTYYRKTGPVLLESDLTRHEKSDKYLFVCRLSRCSGIESGESTPHQILLDSWKWAGSRELRLYEITDLDTPR
jgi:hypothetical protein